MSLSCVLCGVVAEPSSCRALCLHAAPIPPPYCTFVFLMPLNLVVDPGVVLACRMCCPQRAAGIESLLPSEAGQDLDLDHSEMHEDGQGV